MTTQFFLPLKKIPTATAQEHKIAVVKNKPVIYQPQKLKAVKSLFEANLAKHVPKEPFKGAVRLQVMWLFPMGKSHADGEFKITRPDTDNLQKLFKDVMTELHYWKDDAQVCSEHCEKRYAKITGIFVVIEEL